MTLTLDQRTALASLVRKLRERIEQEVREQASGRFGLHVEARGSGHIEEEDQLSLDPSARLARRELVEVVEYLIGQGHAPNDAVTRLIREATFTIINRLLAIRVAEAIGLLPEALGSGGDSRGFLEVCEAFPALAQDRDWAYWTFLGQCADELSAPVPLLFDRRHPVAGFELRTAALHDVIDLLGDPRLATVWQEPETLGWAYQFFNGEDERREMRAASRAPRDSHELAVRNQFFTPRYVVDWLVQNTVGRRLLEGGHDLQLPLLVGTPSPDKAQVDLAEVSILDPAVGSGHFLLGAYDLLEEAWQARGVSPADAAPRILSSLHGVDIDHRAAQVAQAVLVFRAGRAGGEVTTPPQIVTARELPRMSSLRDRAHTELPGPVTQLMSDLEDVLTDAPTLGTLLKVEERLRTAAADRVAAPQLGDEHFDEPEQAQQTVLDELARLAANVEATAAERLLAAEGLDAIRFVDIVRQRYDAVLMNPPFGSPVPETRQYLRATYKKSATDLFSAFVHRGTELTKPDGYVGAITNRTGFFLKTFAGWRHELLLPRMIAMADLGFGVLQDALVEAAAYVVAGSRQPGNIHFRSLLREANKERLADPHFGRFYAQERAKLSATPNGTISYWAAPSLLEAFAKHPRFLDVEGTEAWVGLQTSDDFRFVRLWWEVTASDAGRSQRWWPFAKGGEYSPWYSDLHLVVDWENDGQRIRETGRGRPQNTSAYGQAGLTWSLRTASGLAVRALPHGSIPSNKGCYLGGEDCAALAAWLNSRAARYFIELQLAAGETTSSGGAARSYEVGILSELPYPSGLPAVVAHTAHEQVITEQLRGARDETDRHFFAWDADGSSGPADHARRLEDLLRVDEAIVAAYDLDAEGRASVDAELGPPPAAYPTGTVIDDDEVRRLYTLPMQKLVDHVLEQTGGARYVATKSHLVDRRLELLCHLFGVHPRRIAEAVQGLEPPGDSTERARELVSYLVGVAFGRWDVRCLDNEPTPVDPWAEVDPVPPGMLTGPDGLPARSAATGYPLALPADPLLVDDPGHDWDVTARVYAAADAADIARDDIEQAVSSLGVSDLRAYLRARFFDDHLSRYARSRRYAPIYWPLQVPSRTWTVWLYYPDLSRESLFAVARMAEEKLRVVAATIEHAGAAVRSGDGTRADRDRLESSEALHDELSAFAKVVREVAQSGWQPDHDDGGVLCAAPLLEVFHHATWKREVTKHRTALERGEYPWATVQHTHFGGAI